MNKYKIFIVEDDIWYGQLLQYHLQLNPEYEVSLFTSGKECLSKMNLKPDLITLDFSLPDMKGDLLFKKIRNNDLNVPVIMITAQEDISVAVNLLKLGVSDYLIKDEATKELLWNSIIRLRENQSLKQEVASLKNKLNEKYAFTKYIIGQSEPIKSIYKMMDKASKTNINVSITGETGTGKEMVAKAIHYNSERKNKNFIPVNVAAIPKELIESELFGYEKGAFTGANNRRIGYFEDANKGTIFLDEIAEMDLNLQAKLLRVLQERELVRVGGNKKVKLDIRLIVATHKDLAEEVRKGNFREDLYYRIMGLPINVPPLRNRGNDILILANHFADNFVRENKLKKVSINKKAKVKLLNHSYPGNVRELKSIIELAVVMSDDTILKESDINFNPIMKHGVIEFGQKTLKDYIRSIIKYYLKKHNNDVLFVASSLDMGKSTIYKMIKNGEFNDNDNDL